MEQEAAAAGESSKEAQKKYEFAFLPDFAEACTVDEKHIKENWDAFYTKTKRGNRIACLYMRNPDKTAKYTILFSHGNAADLGLLISEFD